MKHKIKYDYAKSIFNWITHRNVCYYVFKIELIKKFEDIVLTKMYDKTFDIELTENEADGIISALYANSGMFDSSPPKDEIIFLKKFLENN